METRQWYEWRRRWQTLYRSRKINLTQTSTATRNTNPPPLSNLWKWANIQGTGNSKTCKKTNKVLRSCDRWTEMSNSWNLLRKAKSVEFHLEDKRRWIENCSPNHKETNIKALWIVWTSRTGMPWCEKQIDVRGYKKLKIIIHRNICCMSSSTYQ